MNMAVDEALLKAGLPFPVLRVYRWRRPAVSMGYFSRYRDLRAHGKREIVRRWTGGGVVPHGEDFTYSLIAGKREAVSRATPSEAYRSIHAILSRAVGGELEPAAAADPATAGGDCFQQPVGSDVMIGGEKVAGAAQRRTRWGLLHQGSIQGVQIPAGFVESLAGAIARNVLPFSLKDALVREATSIAKTRYENPAWTRKF